MADNDPALNQPAGYVPPKVWTWDAPSGGQFANINRPTSGPTHDKVLPVGEHTCSCILHALLAPRAAKLLAPGPRWCQGLTQESGTPGDASCCARFCAARARHAC